MRVFTIGFTKKSAEQFFRKLRRPGLLRLADVRLNNQSQLAGFTKREDLRFFCRTVASIDYTHLPELAPTPEMLDAYKKQKGGWPLYESQFIQLLKERCVERTVSPEVIDGACLLCSEPRPDYCHRRLVAEYLRTTWGDLEIEHIL